MPQIVSDLDKLVDIIKIDLAGTNQKPAMVAHDYGGLVCSSYAGVHPSKISKLILMNTSHYGAIYKIILTTPSQLLKSFYLFLFQFPFLGELFCCQEETMFRGHGAPKSLTEADRIVLMYQFRNPS